MHIYRNGFLLTTLLLATTSFCTNKIVYLISPPRSLSVAFLRMMQARGDFSIMHEPSQLAWNLLHSSDLVQSWFRPQALQSFDAIKEHILQTSKDSNVFAKEMSFAVRDFHLNDHELMKHPHVYFVFLVRSPHHTIISMYKKQAHLFDASPPHQIADLIGYGALYDVFQAATQHAINKPYIMRTEDLYNNPEEAIKKFCTHVGIDFKPESLHWDDLGEQFDGQDQWYEIKYKELTHLWHGDAIRSTGFGKPTSYEVDAQGNPTFTEIVDLEHRKICKQVYVEELPYYELLIKRYQLANLTDFTHTSPQQP